MQLMRLENTNGLPPEMFYIGYRLWVVDLINHYMKKTVERFLFSIIAFIFFATQHSFAYSVLSHEAIIDETWESSIQPLLKKKYPGATEEQLKEAHAYVYGGAIIPDLGYFPFGSPLFTNLLHYVRSGDFVNNILNEAENLNEYAFALGVLCHYNADNYGHPLGTNRAVPVLFPKLEKKYGDTVTYAQGHIAHTRTEFSFDVLQVVQSDYKSLAYHDFIGFEIAQPLLERAFLKTYGLKMESIFISLETAIGTFRWTVKNLFPELTKDAWQIKRTYFFNDNPTARAKDFMKPKAYMYSMNKKDYSKEFGNKRKKGGPKSWLVSIVIRVFPKIGPMKAIKFTEPVPEVVELYEKSMDSSVLHYKILLKNLMIHKPDFENIDFDTGEETKAGEYLPCDETYCALLQELQKQNFGNISPELGKNILNFFSQKDSLKIKMKGNSWKKTETALEELKAIQSK